MPFCRKCGVELQEDDKFCPNCGATFTPANLRIVAAEKKEAAPEVVEPAKVAPPPQPAVEPAKVTTTATAAPAKGKHTGPGYAGLLFGVIGAFMFFIPINYSDKMMYSFFAMIFGGVGGGFAMKAFDRGDSFGKVGMIIAVIVLLISIVGLLF